MTSVINMNNIPAARTPRPSKKRKYDCFNATRIMTSLYPPEDDSESDNEHDHDPLEYEYYDALGRPYLETVIRPQSLFDEIIKQKAREKNLELQRVLDEISNTDYDMYTSLSNPEESCPLRFIEQCNTWSEAMDAYHTEQQEKNERERREEFEEANRRNSELCEKLETEYILSKLPRFSTAMRARMKAEAEEEAKKAKPVAQASSKYYTEKPVKQGSNVFGHRRNGGGKKNLKSKNQVMVAKLGTISLDSIRDEKYKKMMIDQANDARLSRNIRRANAKLKNEEEEERKARIRDLVESRAAELKTVNPSAATATPPPEETEWQKFKREELNSAIEKQKKMFAKMPDPIEAMPAPAPEEKKPLPKKVIEKSTTELLQEDLTNSFYSDVKSRDVKCTRMCRSFTGGGKCPHGDKCAFAHTIDEFNPVSCTFGARCRNVSCDRSTNLYTNTGDRICMFIHVKEDKDKFCERIGITKHVARSTPNRNATRSPSNNTARSPPNRNATRPSNSTTRSPAARVQSCNDKKIATNMWSILED